MIRTTTSLCLVLSLLALGGSTAVFAGSVVQTVDITAQTPSGLDPNHIEAPVVPQRRDLRCFPFTYQLNTTQDPVPNPLGEDFLAIEDAREVFQQAMDTWNDVPTSFLEYRLADVDSDNEGEPGFDFQSEITFRTNFFFGFLQPLSVQAGFGIISLADLVFLNSDFFLPDGFDLDGDGDPDFSNTIEMCEDIDGDGDFELPEGLYPAGTVLDSDIQFGASDVDSPVGLLLGTRFTVDPDAIDDEPRSVDLLSVAVPVLGSAATLSHVMINQPSDTNGIASTMYPFIDTTDRDAQLARRSLDGDTITTVSWLYPEGSATEGPAALQEGDIAFDDVFGMITGTVHNSIQDNPQAGASVYAVDRVSGQVVANTFSGRQPILEADLSIGALLVPIDPAYNAPDGEYTLVVPAGLYDVGIEAVDDHPVLAFPINLSAQTGYLLGQMNFEEEYYNGTGERAFERSPQLRRPVLVRAGETVEGIDFVTNNTLSIGSFGALDGFSSPDAAPGTYYAVRIPGADFLAADPGDPQMVLHGAYFMTGVARASDVPVFSRAMVAGGRTRADGSVFINIQRPIFAQVNFVGQEEDFTPLYARRPAQVLRKIRQDLNSGRLQDLFLVLQLPVQGDEMPLIGLDGGVEENDVPIAGNSFTSTDGVNFTASSDFNYMFKLVISNDPSVR